MKILFQSFCKICCTFLVSLLLMAGILSRPEAAFAGAIVEFSIPYTNPSPVGSTHEIAFHDGTLWITGQNHDQLAARRPDGQLNFYNLPSQSGPHGIAFDQEGYLWLTLEFLGEIVRLDPEQPDYNSATKYDVKINCTTCPHPINTHPHGLTIGKDGRTVWYTGKATGTLGRITPDGTVETLALSKVPDPKAILGTAPIYIRGDTDGNIWFTELVGNAIGRMTPDGKVQEFQIPTPNSRPIAILQGPDGNMWFTEEATGKVGRIEQHCTDSCPITEFQLPKRRANDLLAALTFDQEGNLWVQQYMDIKRPFPSGRDHLMKIDKQILKATTDHGNLACQAYDVPTPQTVMHRITLGPDRHLWFTELNTDKVAQLDPLTVGHPCL